MKKVWKIILTVAAILILLVLGAAWYLSVHWKKMLDRELKHYVSDASDSLYTLAYGNINLNLLSGSVGIKDVVLLPDSTVYARMVAEKRAPQVVYNATMSNIQVSGMKIWRYFMGKNVDAHTFILANPEITIIQDLRSQDTTPRKSFYESINKNIQTISVGRISLSDTRLSYIEIREDSSRKITKLENLDVQLRGLQIDSITDKDLTRFLYAQNFDLALEKWDYRTPDSLYWLHVNKVTYNAVGRQLKVGEFRLDPRYNKADFDKKIPYQNDRFELNFKNIQAEGISLRNILEQHIIVKKASIDGGALHAYRNRGLPMAPGDKYGQFPNQLLAKLELPMRIDTLTAKGIEVSYTEKNPKNGETGKVDFRSAGGTFTHITNVDSLVKENNHCKVDLHAILMRTGKLRASFDFILGDKSGAFGVSGQLTDFNGREMNPAVRPMGEVAIKSVNIREMSFNFKGNEKQASGTFKMLYSDLKIEFLKDVEDKKGKKRKKGLVSFIANLMALHNDNPSPGKPVRVVHPRFTRDPKKSFFNLIWKTMFTGIKETVLTDAAAGFQ